MKSSNFRSILNAYVHGKMTEMDKWLVSNFVMCGIVLVRTQDNQEGLLIHPLGYVIMCIRPKTSDIDAMEDQVFFELDIVSQ